MVAACEHRDSTPATQLGALSTVQFVAWIRPRISAVATDPVAGCVIVPVLGSAAPEPVARAAMATVTFKRTCLGTDAKDVTAR